MNTKNRKKGTVDSILQSACAKNIPLDLRFVGEKPPTVYRSRFLGFEESPEESVVMIETPVVKGNIVPVRPGSEANVSFTLTDHENHFTSVVVARGRFQLNPQTSVASLELQAPDDILSGGKRAFYRVPVDDSESMEIKLGIFADDESGTSRIRGREKGILTDIGGGGLGFRIPEGKSLLISPGKRLSLRFRLRGDEGEISLVGRVCFSMRLSERREAYFGVQFVDIETDIEYKQNVDRILHFIAAEQRRALGERA